MIELFSLRQNSRPVFSKRTLSLRPRRNSGIPDRKTRILMDPTISLRRTLPLALTWKAKKALQNVFWKLFWGDNTHDWPMVWRREQGSLHCDEHSFSNTVRQHKEFLPGGWLTQWRPGRLRSSCTWCPLTSRTQRWWRWRGVLGRLCQACGLPGLCIWERKKRNANNEVKQS